jgi:hypothetical protein
MVGAGGWGGGVDLSDPKLQATEQASSHIIGLIRADQIIFKKG